MKYEDQQKTPLQAHNRILIFDRQEGNVGRRLQHVRNFHSVRLALISDMMSEEPTDSLLHDRL